MTVLVVNGTKPGPVLAVAAGVHGDEYDGMAAVRRVLASVDAGSLSGTLVGLPCVNQPAFEVGRRANGVDHGDLNRAFPGDAAGSLTQRFAATFVGQVIPKIDCLVDLHTGGDKGEIVPVTIVQRGFEELALPLGRAVGNELLWKGGAWGGTARISTLEAGKPAVTVEAGGGVYRDEIVEMHVESAGRVLRHLQMLDGDPPAAREHKFVDGTFSRAAAGGFLEVYVRPGEWCEKDEQIATIVDHSGQPRERVLAPARGLVIWIRQIRSVQPGDDLIIFGTVDGEIEA
jgi:predicted deacylase